ncbi:MAG: hypothetical protein ACI86M_002682 [Saprospiraceae bacterium]|jgi:hypothetical protein
MIPKNLLTYSCQSLGDGREVIQEPTHSSYTISLDRSNIIYEGNGWTSSGHTEIGIINKLTL